MLPFGLALGRELCYNNPRRKSLAGVMELADVTDSKSVGLIPRVGSSPTTGSTKGLRYWYNVGVLSFCSFLAFEMRIWADISENQPNSGFVMQD